MVEIRFKPSEIGTVPDGSITEAKLADDAVTAPKLADNSVDTAAIQDDAILATKILDGEVKESKVEVKKFIKCGPLSGNRKVIAFGYDDVTEEVVLDHDIP